MKRLFLWITVLMVLFGGLIPFAGALGKTAPPPEFAKWFTYPDGSPCPMPCLFGIRPGVTRWEDINETLKIHPILANSSDLYIQEGPYAGQKTISFHSKNGLSFDLGVYSQVGGILNYVILFEPQIEGKIFTFKDMLLLFGSPQKASINPYNADNISETLFLENKMFLILKDETCSPIIRPQTPISSLTIFKSDMSNQEIIELYGLPLYRWSGFFRKNYRRFYPDDLPLLGCNP